MPAIKNLSDYKFVPSLWYNLHKWLKKKKNTGSNA